MPNPTFEERQEQQELNDQIRNTEQEILDDALGDEPLELDGDTSLEDMDENSFVADVEDSEEEAEESESEEEEVAEASEEEPAEEQESEEEEEVAALPPREERSREDKNPLRQQLRESQEQVRALQERFDNFLMQQARPAQPAQPTPAQPQPKEEPEPDFLAEPDKWKAWNRTQARKEAREEAQGLMSEFERKQQERSLNSAFQEQAEGPRGYEFGEAYRRLTSLDPNHPASQRTVRGIIGARDPAKALWDWWETNGGPEYRRNVARQVAEQFGYELPDGFDEQEAPRRSTSRQQQPRHVTRLPRSLNSTPGGSGRQQEVDARGFDGTDAAIFEYGVGRD